MKYDDEGPSLIVNLSLTCEELSREELEKDLWERIVPKSKTSSLNDNSSTIFESMPLHDELRTKKIIKFKLGGSGCTLTLLEFARRLELYHVDEINDEGFEVYFQGGLRSDDNFNARDYWLSISSEEELHLSKSLSLTIRRPNLRVLQKMITYGDLYDRMGNMEIHQGNLERMTHSQSYQLDRMVRSSVEMTQLDFVTLLKIKKRTGNARKFVKYDNGCLKKDLEENLRRNLMKNSQLRCASILCQGQFTLLDALEKKHALLSSFGFIGSLISNHWSLVIVNGSLVTVRGFMGNTTTDVTSRVVFTLIKVVVIEPKILERYEGLGILRGFLEEVALGL
ncbi:hypothetical protein Tco_0078164 [Tanacetum coccineum]